MLRRRMGDQRFLPMLAELRRRFESKSISTRDLQELVKEFAAKPGAAGSALHGLCGQRRLVLRQLGPVDRHSVRSCTL